MTIVVIAGLAYGVPWLTAEREAPQDLDAEPDARFSDSMRILRRDVVDYVDDSGLAAISTPLTRRAEFTEMRLLAGAAVKRRGRAMLLLLLVLVAAIGLSAFALTPWWVVAIPGAAIVMFLTFARIGVAGMQRRFDERRARVTDDFGDDDTQVLDLGGVDGGEESSEFSIDLSAPQSGMLWDPIPVTAPTYVSKPLVPRTVRTIDLSAPVPTTPLIVPTADDPGVQVEEESELDHEQRRGA